MNKAKLLDIVASYENDSQLIDIDGENVYEPVRYENNKKQPNGRKLTNWFKSVGARSLTRYKRQQSVLLTIIN